MPENASYMHAAYAVAVTTYALYAISLWRRRRAIIPGRKRSVSSVTFLLSALNWSEAVTWRRTSTVRSACDSRIASAT